MGLRIGTASKYDVGGSKVDAIDYFKKTYVVAITAVDSTAQSINDINAN